MLNIIKFLIILSSFWCVSAFAFDRFDCLGNEPFWGLTIAKDKFTYKNMSSILATMPAVDPKTAANFNIDILRVYQTKANNKKATIIVQKQPCSDAMSDNTYDYGVVFLFGDDIFHGCCTKM